MTDTRVSSTGNTYGKERSAVNSGLNELNGRIVANLRRVACRQRYLREAECAGVVVVRWAGQLEYGIHGMRIVERFRSDSHVDVDEGGLVTGEPARLKGDGSSSDRPFRAVSGCANTSA